MLHCRMCPVIPKKTNGEYVLCRIINRKCSPFLKWCQLPPLRQSYSCVMQEEGQEHLYFKQGLTHVYFS